MKPPRLSPEVERARVLWACLTQRERQVAEALAAGKNAEAIAEELGLPMASMERYLATWKLKGRTPDEIARIVSHASGA